ncbi:hypothetical protein AcW1_002495 [Taiwanofungus camphoratus]|nr:hypothetical protein AcW1_002495 [Antrodia cinnamomea]
MTYSANSGSFASQSIRYSFTDQYQKAAYLSSSHHHSHSQPQIPIKVEESPDLPPASSSQHQPSHYHEHRHHHKSSAAPVFRFGSDFASSASPSSPATPFTFMSQQWPGPAAGSSASASASYAHQQQYAVDRTHYPLPSPLNGHGHAHTMSLNDDYDDGEGDELADLPGGGIGGLALPPYSAGGSVAGMGLKSEKTIRRRSSKACDQCRKSKCKCERSSPQDPCRNCVMLGTPCTFLGPSRKRGPPKGYIDAIEARLHQTEALIGILLGSKDSRARGVLDDISEDPLVKEIINRVDNSPYGHKGRSRGAEASSSSRTRPTAGDQREGESSLHSTHPSNEWQDEVIARLNAAAVTRNTLLTGGLRYPVSPADEAQARQGRPVLALTQPSGSSTLPGPPSATLLSAGSDQTSGEYDKPPSRRQRRRLDDAICDDRAHHARSPSTNSLSGRSRSPAGPPGFTGRAGAGLLAHRGSAASLPDARQGRSPEMRDDESYDEMMEGEEGSGEDELAIEVGQLSINEDEQVRFHGKASGLHLLGVKERKDERHTGGIWRFPKARVWPPLPPSAIKQAKGLEEFAPTLPNQEEQELLLELYFTYVHPVLPIVHKRTFMEDFRNGSMSADSPYSVDSQEAASPGSTSRGRGRVPTLLLLAMFSIAARYSYRTSERVPPPEEGSMWAAGDSYLEDAKVILDSTYAASRPSTCQALLLLGYREVGIGAMAQAWLYVGMAVRMAQDLGLHKSADQWSTVGRALFSPAELQERRRIWYGCVTMDKYVSAYIGRPVAIFERDFDTELPSTEESDELESWAPHPSSPLQDDTEEPEFPEVVPVPGYIISSFGASAKLSNILSFIMQGLYAIQPQACRQTDFSRLEKDLSKWYLELPEHLRFDPAAPKNLAPLPHILTLHMQYWCTVILLHRPFIRHLSDAANRSPSTASKDPEVRAVSRKNYDMCVQAANYITSIVSVYVENYSAKRSSAFVCYYIFTAAIMHVATLMTYPADPQARIGLNKCMDVLKRMRNIWPSAWRALELLHGAKVNTQHNQELDILKSRAPDRPKRSAEHPLDQDDTNDAARLMTSEQIYRQQHSFAGVSESPTPAHAGFSLGNLHLPSGDTSTYLHSYDRWSSDAPIPNFGGSLSTSVLPQQYSTGLVDERMPSGMSRHPDRHSQRYPQYWSDYSALGQMDTTYGVPVIGDMVTQHAGASQGDHSSMYVQDQYSMFGNLPTTNHQ